MRLAVIGIAVIAGLVVGSLCADTPPSSSPATTRAAASRPAPIVEVLGAQDPEYVPPREKLSGALASIGSSTVSNLMIRWMDGFKSIHPDVKVTVSGGGSETAPPALAAGTSQLAPMSRPMKKEGRKTFHDKFGYEPTEIEVGVDALAVFVEKTNPALTRGLSLAELDGMFSRDQRRGGAPARVWGDLGLEGEWSHRPIVLYGWGAERSPSMLFRELVFAGGEFTTSLHPQTTSSSIVQAVAAEPGGIGYASVFFQTRRARAAPIRLEDGTVVSPTSENCRCGAYPLARSFYIYVNKPPNKPLPPLTREFIAFVLSRQGQQIVCDGGNFPLGPEKVEGQRGLFARGDK